MYEAYFSLDTRALGAVTRMKKTSTGSFQIHEAATDSTTLPHDIPTGRIGSEKGAARADVLYWPALNNFPAIGFFWRTTANTFVGVQVTVSTTHELELGSLLKNNLWKRFDPEAMKPTNWTFYFVMPTPELNIVVDSQAASMDLEIYHIVMEEPDEISLSTRSDDD